MNRFAKNNKNNTKSDGNILCRSFNAINNSDGVGIARDDGFYEEPDSINLTQLNISYQDVGEEARDCTTVNENNRTEYVNGCVINNTERYKGNVSKTLLAPVTYFLNKSKSKWMTVGLESDWNFQPVIRLMGARGQGITLDSETWKDFKRFRDSINKAINTEDVDKSMNINNLQLSFVLIDNRRKILKANVGNDVVYLSYESLREIWRLSDVITFRLELLESYNFAEFYYACLDLALTFKGDLSKRLESIFNGSCTEYVAIFKELLANEIDRVMYDLDLHQAIKESFNRGNEESVVL